MLLGIVPPSHATTTSCVTTLKVGLSDARFVTALAFALPKLATVLVLAVKPQDS